VPTPLPTLAMLVGNAFVALPLPETASERAGNKPTDGFRHRDDRADTPSQYPGDASLRGMDVPLPRAEEDREREAERPNAN
jgi:hypothetical protein